MFIPEEKKGITETNHSLFCFLIYLVEFYVHLSHLSVEDSSHKLYFVTATRPFTLGVARTPLIFASTSSNHLVRDSNIPLL